MAISLVAYGSDSNPAGASTFVALTVPVGISNGDIVIVGIALPTAATTVTPPDSTWTLITQTDPAQALSCIAYWKVALLEQTEWVFTLSASQRATGVCAVYRGTDPFAPVEAFGIAVTAASVTHSVPGSSAILGGEELVLFMAGATSGTYTPATGYVLAARKQQTTSTIEVQHRQLVATGNITSTTEAFSSNVKGASILIVLAPSFATSTYDDAYQRVFKALPPGIDNALDFSPGAGDLYWYFWTIAAILKIYCFDLYDLLRLESVPTLSRFLLPSWEGIFGLGTSRLAQSGTLQQRQNQVRSALRSAGGQGSSVAAVQAVLAPLLGYSDPATVQIIETSRTALDSAHAVAGPTSTVNASATTVLPGINVTGRSVVSAAGSRLTLVWSANPSAMTVTLTGPDGTTQTWAPAVSDTTWLLHGANFIGKQSYGSWTVSIANASTVRTVTPTLIVEGIGRGERTGAAIYDWGVYADPAHLGENGSGADFPTARNAIYRMAQSHTIGNLLQSIAPYPDTDTGIHASIPDECIPT